MSTTFVAMLRGINVSGRNRLAMDDLRALVTAAGGADVRTYIQSGNAVFTSKASATHIVTALEKGLIGVFGTKVPVLVRTAVELDAVIEKNPFVRRGENPAILHVTFLGAVPSRADVTAAGARAVDDDELQVIGREVYLRCPNGYGTTKLNNTFFEKHLRSEATTRNWKTVTTLAGMAHG